MKTPNNFIPQLLSTLVLTGSLLAVPLGARAGLLVYEGFNYPDGSNIESQTGGFGWADAWDFNSFYSTNLAGSLSYVDGLGNTLITSGGKLWNIGDAATTASSQPGRTLTNTFTDGGTVNRTNWMSFLAQRIGATSGTGSATFMDPGTTILSRQAIIPQQSQPRRFVFMKKVILFTSLLAGGLLVTATTRAALLAYEGFNYPVGDLSSSTGGGNVGFGTNIWSAGTAGDSTLLASLTYTDSLGNSLSNSGNHALITGSGGNSTPARSFDFARGADGTTTWISFVGFRRGADTIRVANLQFRTNTSERIAFGKATTNVATATWSVYHSGTAANSVFSTNALDVASFVLVRIDHLAGNDNAYMWINPLLNAEPALASASVTYTNYADYGFNGIRGFAGNLKWMKSASAKPTPT
jgi:hypothetical protein